MKLLNWFKVFFGVAKCPKCHHFASKHVREYFHVPLDRYYCVFNNRQITKQSVPNEDGFLRVKYIASDDCCRCTLSPMDILENLNH